MSRGYCGHTRSIAEPARTRGLGGGPTIGARVLRADRMGRVAATQAA